MKMTPSFRSMLLVVAILLLNAHFETVFAGAVSFEEESWLLDPEVAQKAAKKEDKDILLLFTGSDWCPPCQKLEEEVLGEADFLNEVRAHYILVKLDYPKNTEQSDELKLRNQTWAEKYGVGGYPTVVLVDKEMLPFAISGYEAGGVANYLGLLEEFRQARLTRDRGLEDAKKAMGIERAKRLDKAMSGMDEQIVSVYYAEIVKEIVKLDNEDEAGLRSKWNAAKDSEVRKLIMTDVLMISRLEKPERALSYIDEVVKEIKFPSSQLLEIMQIKLNLVRKMKDSAAMDKLLDEMINLDGVTGETQQRLIVKKALLMVGTDRKAEAMEMLNKAMSERQNKVYLLLAKGELLFSDKDYEGAIAEFEKGIPLVEARPDLLIDLISLKADALFAMDDVPGAMRTLDNFAEDTNMPSDLRSEVLLHKAMIMRETDRTRQAKLAENRAIEIAESAKERGEIQKMVEQLRAKYEDQ